MSDNPMAPLSRISKRLSKDTHDPKVGVDMVQPLAFMPNDDEDGPHHARAIFTICDGKSDETIDIALPEGLEEQLRNSAVASSEERADAARKDLEALRDELKDPSKGIGLD